MTTSTLRKKKKGCVITNAAVGIMHLWKRQRKEKIRFRLDFVVVVVII